MPAACLFCLTFRCPEQMDILTSSLQWNKTVIIKVEKFSWISKRRVTRSLRGLVRSDGWHNGQ